MLTDCENNSNKSTTISNHSNSNRLSSFNISDGSVEGTFGEIIFAFLSILRWFDPFSPKFIFLSKIKNAENAFRPENKEIFWETFKVKWEFKFFEEKNIDC